jgi:four helix bundle protein
MARARMEVPRRFQHLRFMSFEKMRVYQAAQLLDAEVQHLIGNRTLPRGDDLDQVYRSIGSLLFNIPEAYGSDTVGRKRYHLSVARGSVDETRSVLNRLIANGFILAAAAKRAITLCFSIAKMLTSWMNSLPPS